MKNLVVFFFFFLGQNAYSQRYLNYEFNELDSIIGATYGNAVDYLGDNQNLLFDFYAPHADNIDKRPLIIYIHGGGFTAGTRSYPSIKTFCHKMAKKGYAVASIDYRLDPNFQLYNSESDRRAMADAMHDSKLAIRYFKANSELYKIDTSKVFIGGESAGAITAMMAAYVDKPDEMGPYPMANPNNPVGSSNYSNVGNGVNGVLCLCGMLLDTSAIEDSNDPPVLWMHGSADAFIPLALAFNIVLRAQQINLPVQTKVYDGATHCPWYFGNPNWEIYLDSTINEVTSFLYPKVTTPLNLNDVQNGLVEIFPNPSADCLNIDLKNTYSKINISLTSLSGRVYRTWRFQDRKEMSLNLNDLPGGIGLVTIVFDSHVVSRKIVINKY